MLGAGCFYRRREVAWSVCLCVGQTVSCTKTAELIDVPFGAKTRVGQKNYVLDYGDAYWRHLVNTTK